MDELKVVIVADKNPELEIETLGYGGTPMLNLGGHCRVVDYMLNNAYLAGLKDTVVLDNSGNDTLMEYISHGWEKRGVTPIRIENNVRDATIRASAESGVENVLFLRADMPKLLNYGSILKNRGSEDVSVLQKDGVKYGFMIKESVVLDTIWYYYKNLSDHVMNGFFSVFDKHFGQRARVREAKELMNADISSMANYYINSLENLEFYQNLMDEYPEFTTYTTTKRSSKISGKSIVKNSIIGRGCEVNGYVENSIIAENVRIDKNSKVINSIVLSGNHIGHGVIVYNTIIGEQLNNNPPRKKTIADNSVIGYNTDYMRRVENSRKGSEPIPKDAKTLTVLNAGARVKNSSIIHSGERVEEDVVSNLTDLLTGKKKTVHTKENSK